MNEVVHEIQVKAQDELNLESLINNIMKSIADLKDELKQTREMYEDSYKNNPTFREHEQNVKEATIARNSVREQIAKQPSVANLQQKVKDLRFDLNEKNKTLSDLLVDYKKSTGATQLELFDGQTMQIVESAKLVRAR